MSLNYPNVVRVVNSQHRERPKDALTPDLQEYDLTDPDKALLSVNRLDLFARLIDSNNQ